MKLAALGTHLTEQLVGAELEIAKGERNLDKVLLAERQFDNVP